MIAAWAKNVPLFPQVWVVSYVLFGMIRMLLLMLTICRASKAYCPNLDRVSLKSQTTFITITIIITTIITITTFTTDFVISVTIITIRGTLSPLYGSSEFAFYDLPQVVGFPYSLSGNLFHILPIWIHEKAQSTTFTPANVYGYCLRQTKKIYISYCHGFEVWGKFSFDQNISFLKQSFDRIIEM